jgi:hypothetical protein
VVKDLATGETIPGASIIVKEDQTQGTSTEVDGTFSLAITGNATALLVRSVGYTEQEVALTAASSYTISLKPADYNLDAVVVSASRRQEKFWMRRLRLH